MRASMGKTGAKPRRTEPIEWSADLAYVVGLIASDGCLYNDGRHINVTSKDLEQLENVKRILELSVKIGRKSSEKSKEKIYRTIQFGDVVLYRWLESIGITSNKSKTIGELAVPDDVFFDFLRGSFDGDGSFHSYWDPRWKASYMFYTTFTSASKGHLEWLMYKIEKCIGTSGRINAARSVYQLRFAKQGSLDVLRKMYQNQQAPHLSRKRQKVDKALGVVGLKV
jgi:hypothetical protein